MRVRAAEEDGITLIELLVAMTLSLVVLGVVSGAVVESLRTQRRELAQVEALNGTRTAFERMTRDLRNANPLGAATPSTATATSTADGRMRTVTYRLSAGRLLVDERTVDATTGNLVADPPERVLLAGVVLPAGGAVFRWFAADGTELTGSVDVQEVARVTVRIRVPVRERPSPVDLSTDVVLRNARGVM